MATAKKTAAVETASPQPVKSGITTTEFWICTLCGLFSVLWGIGIIDPDGAGNVNRVAGLIAGGLSALGYGVSRGLAKLPVNR